MTVAARAEADRILSEAERAAEQALAMSRRERGEILGEIERMRHTYEEFLDTLIHAARDAGTVLDGNGAPHRPPAPKPASGR